MTPITAPTPIYEALLALATASERQIILAGGPRELLDNNRMFGGDEHGVAIAAFDAIKSILTRITSGTELCVTGIDPRAMPPRREPLDPSIVLHGLLMWEGPDGCMSKLLLAFLHPVIHIADLRIEPTGRASAPVHPAEMSRSTRLPPGERIDDASRLVLMQGHINQGLTPKRAARQALIAEPYPPATEDSSVTRLCRKFRRLATS